MIWLFYISAKKYFEEYVGTVVGGVTGWLSQSVYKDWIQPILLSAACAFVGLLISHYGKKLLERFESKRKKKKK
jgi:hypothetical protein